PDVGCKPLLGGVSGTPEVTSPLSILRMISGTNRSLIPARTPNAAMAYKLLANVPSTRFALFARAKNTPNNAPTRTRAAPWRTAYQSGAYGLISNELIR